MRLADLPLPSGVRLIADSLFDAVRRGVRAMWRGGEHANAPMGMRLSLLRRLAQVLRFAFLIYATWIETPPSRPRPQDARAQAPRAWRPRRASFRVFPQLRMSRDVGGPARAQPAAFANAVRDPVLTAQRTCDALLAALDNPVVHVRRVARRLPTQLMVFGWRPPKRPPPTHRRQYWDELLEGWREGWFQYREWRRRSRETADVASA